MYVVHSLKGLLSTQFIHLKNCYVHNFHSIRTWSVDIVHSNWTFVYTYMSLKGLICTCDTPLKIKLCIIVQSLRTYVYLWKLQMHTS